MEFIAFNMERFSSARDSNRHSNDHQCLLNSLRRVDTRSRSTGFLEQRHVLASLKLRRTVGCVVRPDFFTQILTKQNSANLLRQYYDDSFYQSYGRQYKRTGYDRSSNTPASYEYAHKNLGNIIIGSKKLASRPV